MRQKPLVVISACLAGQRTRYNAALIHSQRLIDFLTERFRLFPVCPEVEAGLPVPREPINLHGSPLVPSLIGVQTGADYTFRVTERCLEILDHLEHDPPSGMVLKSRSPTCAAVTPIPVHDTMGRPSGQALGVFARLARRRFPDVPVADERILSFSPALDGFARVVGAKAYTEAAPPEENS